MDLSQEFRGRAQRCLALAGAAPTVEAHNHWLSMAQLWLNLAQYSEDQDATFEHAAAIAIVTEEAPGLKSEAGARRLDIKNPIL